MLPAPLGRCERDLFKNMGRRRLRRSSSSTNRIAEGLRLAFLIFPRWALAYRPDHVLPHPLSLELRLGPHEAVDVEAGVAPRENLLTHSALGHQVVEVGVGRMASRNGPSPRMRSRLPDKTARIPVRKPNQDGKTSTGVDVRPGGRKQGTQQCLDLPFPGRRII